MCVCVYVGGGGGGSVCVWQSQIEIENFVTSLYWITSLIPRLSPHKWGEPGNEANTSPCEKHYTAELSLGAGLVYTMSTYIHVSAYEPHPEQKPLNASNTTM